MGDQTTKLRELESKMDFLVEGMKITSKQVDSKLNLFAFVSSQGLWSRRSLKDHTPIKNAFRILNAFKGRIEDPLLRYDSLILLCKVMKWMADYEMSLPGRETNQSFHQQILDISQAAMAISDIYAEAYFHFAESLAWIYCNGPEFLKPNRDVLNRSIDAVIARQTRLNSPGLQMEGYGPWRLQGETLAYSRYAKEAIVFLEKSYSGARNYSRNAISYAITLTDVREDHNQCMTKAKSILEDLLKNNPDTLDVSRIPETEFDFFQASAMLKQPPFIPRPFPRIDDPLNPEHPPH